MFLRLQHRGVEGIGCCLIPNPVLRTCQSDVALGPFKGKTKA
ncbi:hypothetical protein PP707_04955 [Acetobacter pasteurianus]|nr:hypothetical protein [Acetobacter pasteurianus]